jgi:hypothetical protein
MDNRKIGDTIQSLPMDPNQEYPHMEMNFIDEYVNKSKKKKVPLKKEPESDSDSDSDSEDELENFESEELETNKPSLWNELKATFLASLVYVLLSLDIINTSLSSFGLDGFKLSIIKLFLFASIYFVLRYKFL